MQSRWTKWTIAALWAALGVSQQRFAKMLGVDPVTVRRWVLGKHAPTQEAAIEALDKVAGNLTEAQWEEFLGRLTGEQRAHFSHVSGGSVPARPHLVAGTPANRTGDGMHRRTANKVVISTLGTASLGTASLGGVDWGHLIAPRVDAGLVAAHEDEMRHLAGRYLVGDPRELLPSVADFADGVLPMLDRAVGDDVATRLAVVAFDAHAMAGKLASLAGYRNLASRYLKSAAHVADAAADPLMRANIWALLATRLYSPQRGGSGTIRQTVEMLARAKALTRHADGYTRAWVALSFVHQAAEAGDARLCLATIEAADRMLDTATGHDGGFFSPDAGYAGLDLWLRGTTGRVAGLAGHLDEAERLLGDEYAGAASSPRGQRRRVLGDLAAVRAENDEPEGACEALIEIIDSARADGYPNKIERVLYIRDGRMRRWDGSACVAALDERLAALAS